MPAPAAALRMFAVDWQTTWTAWWSTSVEVATALDRSLLAQAGIVLARAHGRLVGRQLSVRYINLIPGPNPCGWTEVAVLRKRNPTSGSIGVPEKFVTGGL